MPLLALQDTDAAIACHERRLELASDNQLQVGQMHTATLQESERFVLLRLPDWQSALLLCTHTAGQKPLVPLPILASVMWIY